MNTVDQLKQAARRLSASYNTTYGATDYVHITSNLAKLTVGDHYTEVYTLINTWSQTVVVAHRFTATGNTNGVVHSYVPFWAKSITQHNSSTTACGAPQADGTCHHLAAGHEPPAPTVQTPPSRPRCRPPATSSTRT